MIKIKKRKKGKKTHPHLDLGGKQLVSNRFYVTKLKPKKCTTPFQRSIKCANPDCISLGKHTSHEWDQDIVLDIPPRVFWNLVRFWSVSDVFLVTDSAAFRLIWTHLMCLISTRAIALITQHTRLCFPTRRWKLILRTCSVLVSVWHQSMRDHVFSPNTLTQLLVWVHL